MGKIINIKDERFGTLVVIENTNCKDKWGKVLWRCLCDCGNIVIKTKSDLIHKMKSCGCQRSNSISKSQWNGYGEISKTYWSSVIKGAVSRKIGFNISIEYGWELFLKQEKKCALSGIELQFSRNRKKRRVAYESQTASLDRIDSNVGYLENNIQWVHKTVNICKNTLSNSEFIELCSKVVSYQ